MRYPGGKGRMYQRLISMMPPHRVYIETHLGGGAILRAKEPAECSIGVEIDPAVVAERRNDPEIQAEIVEKDAIVFLEGYGFLGDELVYCDPPYLPGARRRPKVYRFDYTERDHVELLAVLKRLPCAVMLSGYRSSLYDDALSGWQRVEFDVVTHAGVATEVVWMNYDKPLILHDYSHLGRGFREREAIKRRRGRLLSRIQSLSARERGALYAELASVEPDLFQAALSAGASPEDGHAGGSR
jgi:DNA adenine methylase